MHRHPGYSLLELLVALAIAAILLGLALPAYQQSIIRANRSAARLVLLEVAARQERYRQEYQHHSATLRDLGLADPYYLDAAAQSVVFERAVYEVRLDWAEGEYRGVLALPVNNQRDDHECATLVYGRWGLRGVTGRLAATPQQCW